MVCVLENVCVTSLRVVEIDSRKAPGNVRIRRPTFWLSEDHGKIGNSRFAKEECVHLTFWVTSCSCVRDSQDQPNPQVNFKAELGAKG